MCLNDVARVTHLGWDTVKSIVKSDLAARYAKVSLKGVSRIAIDELYLGSKAKYVTLVLDLDSGRVIWVAPGKGGDALRGFWQELKEQKAKIVAVACNMSAAYWSAVLEHLPKAVLVFDRFHIVKLVNEAVDEVRRGIARVLDLTSRKFIKGKRYLLLRAREEVAPEDEPSLKEALKWNEPLSEAYYLKEELRELWCYSSRAPAERFLRSWIIRAGATELAPFKRLAKTLERHFENILSYYEHPITSGKMEGTNNKIGRLTRLAFGYRDTEFLFLRILALHESTFKMSGV